MNLFKLGEVNFPGVGDPIVLTVKYARLLQETSKTV